MKDLKDYVQQVNESMSTDDLLAIEQLLAKFQKGGSYDDYIDKISDKDGEGPCDEVEKMLDKYDPYMEEVMFVAIENNDTPQKVAKEIQRMAQENENKEGTESHFALEFLEELANFLGIK